MNNIQPPTPAKQAHLSDDWTPEDEALSDDLLPEIMKEDREFMRANPAFGAGLLD